MKRKIKVAAGLLCDHLEHPTKLFATAKGYGVFQGKWEFPGGKVEEGEHFEEALRRELQEELGIEVELGSRFALIHYAYPEFDLEMACYPCLQKGGTLELKEAKEGRWLTRESLSSVDWLPADLDLIEQLKDWLC